MKSLNLLSCPIAAALLVPILAQAFEAAPQPDWSASLRTAGIEQTIPVAEDDARGEDEYRAYVLETVQHLLRGQHSPGDCPTTRDPRACLLAARMLWLLASADEIGREAVDARHSLRLQAAALIRSGSARAPDDRQFLWAHAYGLFTVPNTTLAHEYYAVEAQAWAIEELRRREPDNLQVWLLGDNAAAWSEERLRIAATSRYSESPIWEFIRADLRLLLEAGVPEPPAAWGGGDLNALDAHHMWLLGMYLAIGTPSVMGLSHACLDKSDPPRPSAWDDCLQIAEVLVERGDSMLDLGFGSSLMLRMAKQPEDRERAEKARHLYRYLSEPFVQALQLGEGQAAHLRRLRVDGASELSALRQGLEELGLPQVPPASWHDEPDP